MSDSTSEARRGRPTIQEAALLLLLVVALCLSLGYPLQAWAPIPGLLITEWLLVAAPVLLFVRWRRLPARATLLLARPSTQALVGALLAGVSGWYVVGVLVEQLQSRILPVPPEILEALRKLVSGSGRPLALDLFALAVSPAICEELLFRGLLLRATQAEWSAPRVVALNALLFGAFHLSPYRLLPTAALGLVLTLLALRSRSVVPAMLFHLLNNAMTLLVARYLVGAEGAGLELDPLQALVAVVVFAGGLALALGRGASSPDRANREAPRG